jgi:hypothetical protein
VLQDGIGTASEVEEPLDPLAARAWLDAPSALLDLESELGGGEGCVSCCFWRLGCCFRCCWVLWCCWW